MCSSDLLNEVEDANTADYEAALEDILDVDLALRYFAVNTYLVNLDSYQSEQQQNYVLHLNDGKATIVPWDYNYSYGVYGTSTASEMINFSIDDPVINVSLAQRPLLNVLLQNDTYRSQYEGYLADVVKIVVEGGEVNGVTYEANYFDTKVDKLVEMIQESVETDPTAFYTYEQFTAATEAFKLLNTKRAQAVVQQIADNFELVDDGGIDLRTLGDNMGGKGGNNMRPDGFEMPEGFELPEGFEMPEGMMPGSMRPDGMTRPEGMQLPNNGVVISQ